MKISTKKTIKLILPSKFRRKMRKVEYLTRTFYLLNRYPNGRFISCNGAKIYVNYADKNYTWYINNSDYLKHEFSAFSKLFDIRKPSTIIDIGSHWGFYPAIIDSFCNKKEIEIDNMICIEPDKRNVNQLKKTISQIKNFPITLVNKAISDSNSVTELYSGDQDCAHLHHTDNSVLLGKVETETLTSIVNNANINALEITHIKLDIDGYEPAFFKGALSILKQHRPLLLIEFWAKGIISAGFDIKAYWLFLNDMYSISEVKYPDKNLVTLSVDDFSYIRDKTMNGITNLILLPK